ncbi:unnamed protein product [Adineta steineri]|uniref:Uncharacterized protein n=1 Tax=Adineta steineri TaxID=433720 RepID=A0A819MZX5_9BILA|nr:unnamed protein product [Adineta steineri]
MNYKAAFHWLYEQIYNYNLFILEETEYSDDEEEEEEGETDPASVLKQQKYTTWLYILLLIVSCYILLYTAFMKPEDRKITVFDVTPVVFEQLYRDHAKTLSCPCSTITVPLKLFVSNTITHHPVCESIFISKEWIEALHLENASRYGTDDFRTTASSQFKILESLCSLSQDLVSKNLFDLDNNEFINNYLLSQKQVEDKVNGTIEFFKNSASSRIISFLNYVRTTNQADYLISALNTNYLIANTNYKIIQIMDPTNKLISGETKYSDKSNDASLNGQSMGCSNRNPTTTVGFSETSHVEKYYDRSTWTRPRRNATLVSGFFTACTPLEAILQSTLDCLYTVECLRLYGGLTIILRLIAPFLINIWLKCQSKYRNVFHGSFLTLLLFTSLSTAMAPTTEPKPSLSTYRDLQAKYSKSLRCPCSQVTIPHRKFVSLSPVLHQVCESDFVTEEWLLLLKSIRTRRSDVDWRNRAFSQFHLLSELCKLANKTIDDARHRFLSEPFIVSNILPEIDFEKQLNLTLEQFFQSTIDYFGLLIKTVQILIQIDQPYSGPIGAYTVRDEDENPVGVYTKNETNGRIKIQVEFQLTGPRNAKPIPTTCICAFDTYCQTRTGIYDVESNIMSHVTYISRYIISGLITGCSVTDSLLRSTLDNIDRRKAKRLGQWATRLYLVSFAVGLVILTLHTIIRPQEFTKDFDGPSLDLYTKLFKQYGAQLKCPCSSIASTYNQFMNIEARFHEICSSPFASTEGRLNLTVDVVADLVANLSMYNERDYRRFLSAHLQFLEGLCQLSDKTVNIFTRQFLSSLFVTNELLSEMNFHQRLNLTIDQSKLNVPTTLTHLLYLIRMINNGNAFISTYGTNFEYIHPWEDIYNTYTPTQAMIYDNNCSCGLYSNCTTQATFILTNPSEIIPIKGLKIGCTPSESFRASTLECFYNESCINLIKQYTIKANRINNTSVFEPLSTQNISFSINTPIAKLIDNLFITDWNIKMNYTSYFEQCFPLSCSYNNIQRFNVFHIIATLLGLQGGLALVLEWICPKIIRIIVKIYEYRKKRRNVVQSVFTVETIPIESIDNSVSILELTPMNETFQ